MTWKAIRTVPRPFTPNPPKKTPTIRFEPTPEDLKSVLVHMDDRWSRNAYGFQQRIREAIETGDYNAANRWTWCAGVATDKILLLRGQPTEIVANLHDHRHDISAVMDKLASAARVVANHQRKGYLGSSGPVSVPVATAKVIEHEPALVPSSEPATQ